MKIRPPVVAVMGHVDHGKTTLLDFIRKTRIAERESGGITQSIGAYEIEHAGKQITFIDTPGHEAFANMRAHGARVADLAILVVAADDGVKPQTKDALAKIKEAQIPFVVAINKMDKPGADLEKTKADLSQNEIFLEGYGGDVSWHAISAKTGDGVSELLDLVLLASEIEPPLEPMELTSGVVISVRRDPRRGVVIGIVLKSGILKPGMFVATPSTSGKVRAIENFLGKPTKEIFPSSPCVVLGFEDLPKIGEVLVAGNNLDAVQTAVASSDKTSEMDFESDANSKNSLRLILKAEESASLEALIGIIRATASPIPLQILSAGIGPVHETDVKAADSAHGIVVAFRSEPDKAAENLSRSKKIPILSSSIIYELQKSILDYARTAAGAVGSSAEILGVFGERKGKEQVIGGKVTVGSIKNKSVFEIWNGDRRVGAGKILNLQSNRADAEEVTEGNQFGMLAETDEPVKVGCRLAFLE